MKTILVHGLGQTPSDWNKTIDCMGVDMDYACPNLSDMLKDKKVQYENLYNAFSNYCNQFDESFSICGLSLGGVLALQYAIEYPQRVNSLILIATQYVMPKKLLAFQNVIFRLMPQKMFHQMGFGKEDFIELSKSMMTLDFSGDLEKVACPVLVICGERDNANMKPSKELAQQLPDAELRVIEKSGHEVNVEQPEQLAELISNFL